MSPCDDNLMHSAMTIDKGSVNNKHKIEKIKSIDLLINTILG
jgi:hypothetical protein